MQDYRRTSRIALPAVAENLLNSSVLLVDALMVARIGDAALAAVGLSGVVLWRARALGSVLQIGLGAVTSRRWGEGNERAASTLLSHGLVLGLMIGLIPTLLIPFAKPLFASLNAEGDVLMQAALYFQLVIATTPLRMASGNLCASLRACGDTRTPMIVTLGINILNAVLNYILIFGHLGVPPLGLLGAGISTVIAFVVEAVALTIACRMGIRPLRFTEHASQPESRGLIRLGRDGFRPWIPGTTGSILRISAPTLGEEIAVSVGFMAFIAMIAKLGEEGLAAHTSVARLESFSFMIGYGMSVGAASLVGQSLGARRVDMAKRAFAASLVSAACSMSLAGILMIVYSHEALGLFYGGEGGRLRMIELAAPILIIAALEQPFIGMAMVLGAGLRGAGMTTAPFISQIAAVIGVRIGIGYLLAFHLGMGLEGIYWATVADWVVRCLILGYLVYQGRWARIAL